MKTDETLEEWVERTNKEPTWREVAIQIDALCPPEVVKAAYTEAIEVFVKDVFSLRWPIAPRNIDFNVSNDVLNHSTYFIVSARQEVTRKVPPKEQLWVALRSMYEESKNLKALNINLSDRISDLEEQIELLSRQE